MGRRYEGEQNWYPISRVGWFTNHMREGVQVTADQLKMLEPAREKPWVLDDATVDRLIKVHLDQRGDLQLFQNQADRWKTEATTAAERRKVGAYEALIADLRDLNDQVLAVADELSAGTINKELAKPDAQVGLEALMRGMRPER